MPDRAESVQKIIEELQAGISVEENFRLLCDLYHRPLYHFFAKRGFPAQDCLDLTQETFLGIYRGIGSFRRDARFETWLFKVATNAFRKRLRWGTADKRAGEEVPLEAESDGDRALEERVRREGRSRRGDVRAGARAAAARRHRAAAGADAEVPDPAGVP